MTWPNRLERRCVMKCPQCNTEIPADLFNAAVTARARAGRVGSPKVAAACRRNVLKRWAAVKAKESKDGMAT